MKKKKAKKKTVEKSDSAPKKSQRHSGGFRVYVKEVTDTAIDGSPEETVARNRTVLHEIVGGLKDTGDALKWIKANAEEYQNQTLVIAQVKQEVSLKIETITRVTIS